MKSLCALRHSMAGLIVRSLGATVISAFRARELGIIPTHPHDRTSTPPGSRGEPVIATAVIIDQIVRGRSPVGHEVVVFENVSIVFGGGPSGARPRMVAGGQPRGGRGQDAPDPWRSRPRARRRRGRDPRPGGPLRCHKSTLLRGVTWLNRRVCGEVRVRDVDRMIAVRNAHAGTLRICA